MISTSLQETDGGTGEFRLEVKNTAISAHKQRNKKASIR